MKSLDPFYYPFREYMQYYKIAFNQLMSFPNFTKDFSLYVGPTDIFPYIILE